VNGELFELCPREKKFGNSLALTCRINSIVDPPFIYTKEKVPTRSSCHRY